MPRVAQAGCVALLVAVLTGCGDRVDGASRGKALREGGIGIGVSGPAALAVGREYALFHIPLANQSQRPVTLERVDVFGLVDPDVAEVRVTDLERWPPDATFARGGNVEIVRRPQSRCTQRRIFTQLKGYVLETDQQPFENPFLAVIVRPQKQGDVEFEGLRVFYRQGALRYYQDMGLEARLVVRRKPASRPKGESSRACALVVRSSSR